MTYLLRAVALLCLLAVPAAVEALSLPGCGAEEFLVYVNGSIVFENGPVNLTGNVFSFGTVHVGSNNIIHGTVSAPDLYVGTGAIVDVCATNNKTGPGSCGSTVPFAPEAACVFPPLPVPTFPAVCSPGTDFTAAADTTLAQGCYNKIRVNKGVTLTLDDGGAYFAKSEIRVLNGGTLGAAGAAANVVTKSIIVGEENATWKNMNLTTLIGIGNAVNFGNASIIANVQLYAPFGGVHPKTGTRLDGTTELIAASALIQPINNTPPPGQIFCACPPGTTLAGPPTLCVTTGALAPVDLFLKSLARMSTIK